MLRDYFLGNWELKLTFTTTKLMKKMKMSFWLEATRKVVRERIVFHRYSNEKVMKSSAVYEREREIFGDENEL
jgi:hypothetical protein